MIDISRISELIGGLLSERGVAETLEAAPIAEVLERVGVDPSLTEGWVPSDLADHLQSVGLSAQIPEEISSALEHLGVSTDIGGTDEALSGGESRKE